MPTYVYRCEQGHTFELFHGISDESPKRCPECGGDSKRVPAGGAGLLFRGSGFYVTDHRSQGYREAAKQESGGSSEKPSPKEKRGAAPPESGSAPGGAGPSGGGRHGSGPPSGGAAPKPDP